MRKKALQGSHQVLDLARARLHVGGVPVVEHLGRPKQDLSIPWYEKDGPAVLGLRVDRGRWSFRKAVHEDVRAAKAADQWLRRLDRKSVV